MNLYQNAEKYFQWLISDKNSENKKTILKQDELNIIYYKFKVHHPIQDYPCKITLDGLYPSSLFTEQSGYHDGFQINIHHPNVENQSGRTCQKVIL